MTTPSSSSTRIVLFELQEARRVWHEERLYFAIIDIISVLTKSKNPQVYWRVLKRGLMSGQTVTHCNGSKRWEDAS